MYQNHYVFQMNKNKNKIKCVKRKLAKQQSARENKNRMNEWKQKKTASECRYYLIKSLKLSFIYISKI